MKTYLAILFCILCGTLSLSAQTKPNIVLIYADDQGWVDVGYNSRNDELVSALDMAPTFINLAGGKIPDYMEGRIFFGPNKQPEPKYLFAMRDRHGMNVDRCRSVCSDKYKYIRNYVRGMTCFENGLNNVAAANAGERLFKQGKLSAAQAAYYLEKPKEELYDLKKDPFELNNLAKDSAHQETIAQFRAALENWIERTGDDVRRPGCAGGNGTRF